ncbi:LuxR family transcriptional regulator [Paracoccus aestuarii]|uniref:LuxR family transcriptional regulator n=2 Tax=Paracoccus aestuarii TaxID=453842 RepID=A0A418ZY85_9RHOB|nr:autoinducer binding domain-containing protein [Paracoccus aestuarii]RJL05462.1 LuxR family transcriptional regulator [Paracoccus aestuarii]WCR01295.1 autoinducer binding domain-containing protein [Paracoccus aestuarii]
MLELAIPGHETELERLHDLGTTGFFLGFGLRYGEPDFFLNRYPKVWTDIYEAENYFFGDPVAVWTIARTGMMRWSANHFPDPRGIMERAAEHGLAYGATFVVKVRSKRSFLSLARPDRELTDDEMDLLLSKLTTWAQLFARAKVALSEAERDALKLLQHGHRQSEAADLLGISVSGLKARLDGAQKKLGATNTTSAVSQAIRLRLI